MTQPNILLITADQLRADILGCNGNRLIRTPNLDRLAASGVNFSRACTPNPICVPARAALTTGCYPHRCTGSKNNNGAIRQGFPLLGAELAVRGYQTYAMGKLHYLPYMPPGEPRTTYGLKKVELCESGRMIGLFDPSGATPGIEDYHDYLATVGWGGYSRANGLGNNDIFPAVSPIPEAHFVDAWVCDRALFHLERHVTASSDRPFFMWASFPKPHSAFDPPRPWDVLYDPREMPAPAGDIGLLEERGIISPCRSYHRFQWRLFSPEAKKLIRAHYQALISFQDKQVGRLLDFLEENHLRENTIVVYTADHGEMLGDFGIYFKSVFYEGALRVPFMISYPARVPAGRQSGQLAALQDILPTVLALAGAPLSRPVDGCDLAPALFNDRPVRDHLVAQCLGDPLQQYMITDGNWKYIYHQENGVQELYRLDEDPRELVNLASDTAGEAGRVTREMNRRLVEWCAANGDEQMLAGDGLKVSAAEPVNAKDYPPGPFGRRWY